MQYIYFQTLQRQKERLSLLRARLRPDHPAYRHAVRHPATVGEVSSQLVLCSRLSSCSVTDLLRQA